MKSLKKYENFIFDFDGTIADSLPIHANAFRDVLAPHFLKFNYYDYSGMSTAKAFKLIFDENRVAIDDSSLNELVVKKQQTANQQYQNSIGFINGAEEFIRSLAKNDKKLFVASSGSRVNVETGLKKLNVYSYFKGVITSSDIMQAKPDPEIFLKVIERYKLDITKTLVIEDANSGLTAALKAGLEVVCINQNIKLNQENKQISIISYSALLTHLND